MWLRAHCCRIATRGLFLTYFKDGGVEDEKAASPEPGRRSGLGTAKPVQREELPHARDEEGQGEQESSLRSPSQQALSVRKRLPDVLTVTDMEREDTGEKTEQGVAVEAREWWRVPSASPVNTESMGNNEEESYSLERRAKIVDENISLEAMEEAAMELTQRWRAERLEKKMAATLGMSINALRLAAPREFTERFRACCLGLSPFW